MRWLKKNRVPILFAALILAALFAWQFASARSTELRVSFLDVGQGDAVFVEFPDGNQVLIDGGPDATILHELSEVMQPWDRSIDAVVLTHPDADHLVGLLDVLARYDVSRIVETGIRKDTAISALWDKAIEIESAEVVTVEGPMRLRIGDAGIFDILWPQRSVAGKVSDKPNDDAIVGVLRYGRTSFLFPADIERSTESQLLAAGVVPDVDVLKVAHHGSKTSTSEAFLNAAGPEIAVILVGEGNRYGHPHPSVLDRLTARGVRIFRTDQGGRIEITSTGTTMAVGLP